jgi:hypothetical protein
VTPGVIELLEGAAHLPQRLPLLGASFRVDQIGKRFGLRQIELSMFEGAPRELSGLRRPDTAHGGEHFREMCDDRAPAVDMKFRHILAGETVRRREPQHQSVINKSTGGVVEFSARRTPRFRQ